MMQWYYWLIIYGSGLSLTVFYLNLFGIWDKIESFDESPVIVAVLLFWPITALIHLHYYPACIFPRWIRKKLPELKKQWHARQADKEATKNRKTVAYNKEVKVYSLNDAYRSNAVPIALISLSSSSAISAYDKVELLVNGKVYGKTLL